MTPLIIILSTQCPGYGGASTNAYSLIQYLRSKSFRVVGLFLEDNEQSVADPQSIGMVHKLALYPFLHKQTHILAQYRKNLIAAYGWPHVTICKNYMAPFCSKILYPRTRAIYLIAGLVSIIEKCTQYPASKILSDHIICPLHSNELFAMRLSDMVVTNSNLTYHLLEQSKPPLVSVYPVPVNTTYLPLKKQIACVKTTHLMIASSILTRPEKNNLFLLDILRTNLTEYTKCIVGENSYLFADIPNATIYPLLPHSQFIHLLSQCKVYLCASLYDSNPNTVAEALNCDCSVLVSNNIGCCEYLPPSFVCESYCVEEWVNKARYLIDYFPTIANVCVPANEQHLIHLVSDL